MAKTAANLSGAMYPNPVVLLTCGQEAEANIITIAWAGTVCGDPWTVAVGVRPGRHSYGLLMRYREFVVNVPTVELMQAVSICGSRSGRDTDKWAAANLHREDSESIRTPSILECPVSLECQLKHTLDLGQHTLFLGEVLRTRKDPDWKGIPSPPVYMEGKYYAIAQPAVAARH